MAKYKSRYPELTFYVGSEAKRFTNGIYETDDKATQDVLNSLSDVAREAETVSKPKASEPKPKAPKAKAKPSGK